MIEQVHWFARTPAAAAVPLQGDTTADVVVIGGGMAGLSAVEWVVERGGMDVVLLEGRRCGTGATGRSSGFITPDAELQVVDLVRRFGEDTAKQLWLTVRQTCEGMRQNVAHFAADCDFVSADCLYVGAGRGARTIREEHAAREGLGLDSTLYDGPALDAVLARGSGYAAGVRYGGTFGIDGHAYAAALKASLVARGARIHEDSAVVALEPGRARTAAGSVRARHVVVCLDRFAAALGVARDTWHAQTFLVVSDPLPAAVQTALFPAGPMMAWDTDLIYQYFRLTGDGRLLVGGGSLRETYANEHHGDRTPRRLVRFIRRRFPILETVAFRAYWPGLIGVTRDLLAHAGTDGKGRALGLCAAGLPWSVLAGQAAARAALGVPEPLDPHFAPTRRLPLGRAGAWLPRAMAAAVSHLVVKQG